jgi:hypothetical protein
MMDEGKNNVPFFHPFRTFYLFPPVGQPVELLLAFTTTVIHDFSLHDIHDQDFYPLVHMYTS